ncbi:MAG: Gfo/Idh/MocA family oxidoreductase [Candidatus Brocadiia bacterium]
MDEVRTCIVGMGIGRPNGRAIAANERGRVTALCDIVEEKMEEFAEELPEPVKLYTDYEEMCEDPEIDAVFVGTPNQLHVPVALEAIRNEKHVLVTKPLSDSLDAAREVVEAAESAGVVGMMSLSTRFSAGVRYLADLAEQGDFGELYYGRARSIRRSGIPDWSLGFIQEGGGAFRDMGVHVLDSAWWLMGMPRPVSVSGVAGAKFGPRGRGYWNYKEPEEEFYSQYAADDYGQPRPA